MILGGIFQLWLNITDAMKKGKQCLELWIEPQDWSITKETVTWEITIL